ncbi:hypothetical protein A2U01_0047496, partial [Trifolium medium]|nr:hypothetical protein [Trifolium medium]
SPPAWVGPEGGTLIWA